MKQIFRRTIAILIAAATLAMFAVGCEDKENDGTLVLPAESAVKKENMEESTTESATQETTMDPGTPETLEEPNSTEIYVEQAAPYEVGEMSVDLLTSHWLMESVQSNYVFRFFADGTFKSYYDGIAFGSDSLTLSDSGTYTLDGNNLTIHYDRSGFTYTVTYLRKDQHPEITNWDCAFFIPEDHWFFYESDFEFDVDILNNAHYFSWVEDDSIYDSCKKPGESESNVSVETESEKVDGDVYTAFLNSKGYYNEKNGNRMTEYCIIDIDQDGVEDLILQGLNGLGGTDVLVYTYNVDTQEIVSLGEPESTMFALRYSPSNCTIITCWRTGVGSGASYLYSMFQRMDDRLECVTIFSYYSATKKYVDKNNNEIPMSKIDQYLDDADELVFTNLP